MMFDFNLADGKMNGFEIAFLQSEEYADEVISRFKETYDGTQIPDQLLDAIVADMGLGHQDLMIDSVHRIENTISNYLEAIY